MIPTEEIFDYIKAGKKIQAVKFVRDHTGLSLKDAKNYVDELERTMKIAPSKPKQLKYTSNIFAIDGMDGYTFENFCADLLRQIDFSEVKVTPSSGDQGVDILATKDGIKYAIQCKNYASALGNTPVQEVSAGKQFYNCHVGVVITNSTFTPGAIQLADATNVLLWDRNKLNELISKAGGLERLGICTNHADFDSDDEIKKTFDEDFEYDFDLEKHSTAITNTHYPRKGMKIWSKICIAWSMLCLISFINGLFTNVQELIMVGLGEGLFVLVLGLMFGMLSKTDKGNPNMTLAGKNIKKRVFVISCIIIAFVFFIGVIGITGGLNITT